MWYFPIVCAYLLRAVPLVFRASLFALPKDWLFLERRIEYVQPSLDFQLITPNLHEDNGTLTGAGSYLVYDERVRIWALN